MRVRTYESTNYLTESALLWFTLDGQQFDALRRQSLVTIITVQSGCSSFVSQGVSCTLLKMAMRCTVNQIYRTSLCLDDSMSGFAAYAYTTL